MSVDLAVVPVAGRGTRLLPLTKSQPKEMLPVGRKSVVQYVVEELARCGIGRLLFVTGPGKTAIENHFDIDAELIAHLRTSGKRNSSKNWPSSGKISSISTPGSGVNWGWAMRCSAHRRLSGSNRLWWRWATRSSG